LPIFRHAAHRRIPGLWFRLCNDAATSLPQSAGNAAEIGRAATGFGHHPDTFCFIHTGGAGKSKVA